MKNKETERDLIAVVSKIVTEKVPFNKFLNIKVETLEYDRVVIRVDMRDDLIGNYVKRSLHGGVIASIIDVAGNLAAHIGIQQRMPHQAIHLNINRLAKLGTIDLRIDYLRPGTGECFIATAYTLRTGNKVAVARIELHNDRGDLIAVGTGSFIVS